MIITNIYGGLGNQMFQYALGRSLSILHNRELKLNIEKFHNYELREFTLDKFNIRNSIATIEDTKMLRLNNKYILFFLRNVFKYIPSNNIYFEKEEFCYDSFVCDSKANYFIGYWQSYKYFENIRELLLKEFTLKEMLNLENSRILKKIESTNSISIHIRRGDYMNNTKNKYLYNVFGLEYYSKAIDFIGKRVENPHFFIFSDDLAWSSENLKLKNVTYVDANSDKTPEFDLVLMSNCKHNIIANSTFSWWAAWLNQNLNKIIIAPKEWMSTVNNLDDLYPQKWIRM